jgi:hypothetical protein
LAIRRKQGRVTLARILESHVLAELNLEVPLGIGVTLATRSAVAYTLNHDWLGWWSTAFQQNFPGDECRLADGIGLRCSGLGDASGILANAPATPAFLKGQCLLQKKNQAKRYD